MKYILKIFMSFLKILYLLVLIVLLYVEKLPQIRKMTFGSLKHTATHDNY